MLSYSNAEDTIREQKRLTSAQIIIPGFSDVILLGAAMAPVSCRDLGVRGLWMTLFHTASAFCNAGFDLMGVRQPFSSLTAYAAQPVINVTVMLRIITGVVLSVDSMART